MIKNMLEKCSKIAIKNGCSGGHKSAIKTAYNGVSDEGKPSLYRRFYYDYHSKFTMTITVNPKFYYDYHSKPTMTITVIYYDYHSKFIVYYDYHSKFLKKNWNALYIYKTVKDIYERLKRIIIILYALSF